MHKKTQDALIIFRLLRYLAFSIWQVFINAIHFLQIQPKPNLVKQCSQPQIEHFSSMLSSPFLVYLYQLYFNVAAYLK
jgi:hypothetical protein